VILIAGVALATATLVPLAQGQSPTWAGLVSAYDGLIAAIIVIAVIVGLLWAARQLVGAPVEDRHHRSRRDRHGHEGT